MMTKDLQITDLPGVGAATADKLIAAGFDDLLSVAATAISKLVDASGVSEVVARKMIQAARDNLNMGFRTGTEMLKKRDTVMKISTGSKNIDEMMGGGFESGAITECFGQYGSGKTQIGHALAVSCQVDDEKGVAVYIDTENTFRPERIKQFAEGFGVDPDKALKNVLVARAFNSDHQMVLAEKIEDIIKKGKNVKIVIVDSLTAHFRAEFIGRGTLAERQQKLNKHMRQLSLLADKFNVAIYVTNQVMAKPDAFFGDPTEAIGGHIVGHNCVEENSIIYTPDGLMKIKSKPKKVFTLNSSNGKLGVQPAKDYSFKKARTIRIFANNIIEATENHRFPIKDNKSNKIVFKQVKELKKGDYLIIPKKIVFEGTYQKMPWNSLKTYNYHSISKPRILTENTAYILGVFLGDANIDKRSIGIKNEYRDDLEIVNKIVYDLFSVEGKITKVPKKRAYRLRINSKELVNNLDIKHNKDFFLNMISKSPSSVRMAFISGMIDTDGSLQREIDISQADKSVLDYIQGMLLFDGIQSIIREQNNNRGFSKKDGKLYHLRVRSNDCKKLAEKLVMKYNKRNGLAKYIIRKTKGYYKTFEWKDFMTFPITKIEEGNLKNVIDLNVGKDHTFVVNGISSHNSTFRIYLRRGKKNTRVAKLIDSPNLPDAECIFQITETKLEDV